MPCFLPHVLAAMLGLCAQAAMAGPLDPNTVWQLREIDGVPFTAQATLSFPEEGRVTGEGSCNMFRAAQSLPYPRLAIRDIAATRRMCPDNAADARFFAALETMTLAEASAGVLRLTAPDGREMVFEARHDLTSRP